MRATAPRAERGTPTLERRTDEELLRALRVETEARAAMDEIVRRLQRRIEESAYGRLRNYDDAHDAFQVVILRIWRKREEADPSGSLRAWAYGICTNVCHEISRKRSRRGELPLEAASEPFDRSETPFEAALGEVWEEAFWECVGSLQKRDRKLFLDVLNVGRADYARIIGMKSKTLASRVQKIKRSLENCMEGKGFEINKVNRPSSSQCEALQEVAVLFLDPADPEAPDEPEVALLRRHLAECAECQHAVEANRKFFQAAWHVARTFPPHEELEKLAEGREQRLGAVLRRLDAEYERPARGWIDRLASLAPAARLGLLRQVVSSVLLGTAPGELAFFGAAWDALSAGNLAAVRAGEAPGLPDDEEDEPSILGPLIQLALEVDRKAAAAPEELEHLNEAPIALTAQAREQFWSELRRQAEGLPE